MTGRARVLLGFGAFGLFWGSWGALLPGVQRHAHVDDGGLGLALVWIGIGAVVSLRSVGGLADRYPRATLPVSVAALGLSTAGPVLADGTVALSVACAVVGLCSGAADAAMNAAGAAHEAVVAPVLNLAHGVFSASVLAASLAIAGLITGADAPWLLVVTGTVLVVGGAVVATLPVTVAVRARDPAGALRLPAVRVPRVLLVLGSLGAVAYLVENAWQSWAAIQLHSTLHATAAVAALGPAVFAGLAAAGRFAAHPVQRHWSSRRLLVGGAGVAAFGSAVAALAPSIPVAFVGIALAGLGTSVCAPLLIGAAGASTRLAPGAATGTVITLSYLGFVFGPAAVGLLAQATSLRTALGAVAVAAALLALSGRALPETSGPTTKGG